MPINNGIINQKGTPAFYSDIFANRPAFGYAGRVFISTDTGAIYEDTGTAWTLIADAGAGTTGTLQQVTTNGNTTTLGISVQGIEINDGAGTGAFNLAVGNSALALNTTGNANVAIGQNSLNKNTTGYNSTAIGYVSLQNNTGGHSNTAIGYSTLQTNTTGVSNTAVGNSALSLNTTGANNTAVGTDSLQSNTIGYGNTSIGNSALINNTTGYFNGAIGANALRLNSTGIYNNALGTASLYNNTTGSYNTAVGQQSGTDNTTGSNNTFLGYNAGFGITTGSNNTIIGRGVSALSTTLANNIVLSDGAGNVRLFSDANGLIGINQAVGSTIGGQLDIHTTQTYALVLNGLTTSNAYTAFSNNSVGKWRIGNTYNAGANSFDLFNLNTSATALSFDTTTNNATFTSQGYFAGATASSGLFGASRLIVNNEIGCQFSNTTGTYFRLSCGGVNQNVTFIADVFTGTATNLDFNVNAGQKMRIVGATGNVLIGSSTTDDTTNKLQVTGSGKFTSTLSVGNPSALGTLSIGSDGTTTNQIRLTHTGLGTNGSFDIGITSTTANLVANYATTPISMAFFTGAVERLKIDASGYIVTSSVTYGNTTGSAANMYIFGVGDYGIGRSVSSIKYKTQIEDIEKKYVDNLYKMRPIWYRSLCEKDKKEWSHFGFIAEEMEKIEPRFVHYNKDEQGNEFAEGVQYDRITALLVKAVQELKAEIDALKNN